jgi:hypothetical protein
MSILTPINSNLYESEKQQGSGYYSNCQSCHMHCISLHFHQKGQYESMGFILDLDLEHFDSYKCRFARYQTKGSEEQRIDYGTAYYKGGSD